MPPAVLEGTVPRETTWPDVVLAVVGFAREDSWGFEPAVIAVGIAIGFIFLCMALFWLAFLKLERAFRKNYLLRRRARAKDGEAQDSFSGGGTDD